MSIKRTTASTAASTLTLDMFAYPTARPTWMLSIKDADSGTDRITSSFSQSIDSKATGFAEIIREALDQSAENDQEDEIDSSDMRSILNLCHKQLVYTLEGVLYESIKYEFDIDCAYEARELCYASTRPLDALLMVLDKIPRDAEWSDTKNIGLHRDGEFKWVKATFGMKWSMAVGYPIMLERVRRRMESKLKAVSTSEEEDGPERPAKRSRTQTE